MSARGRCDRAVAHESAVGRFCCKSRKIPGDVFFERNEAKLCSPSNMAPRPLAKPPVSLSLGDEVPHIFIRESHQQPRKILISGGKRLLQQNLPQADSCSAATNISYPPSLSGLMRTSRTISLLNSPPLQSRDQTRQAPLYRVRHRYRQRQGEARFRGRHRVPCASRQHPSAAYTPWQADCRKWPIGSAGKDCRGLLLPGGPFHLRYGPPDRSAAQRRLLSRGSNPWGYPHKPLVSYRINRQLSVWILPPLMIRAFGAHCQVRTHAVQQRASSFDEFVGELLEMQRHIETERLGGLEVDHQFVLDGGYGLPCAPEVRGHAHAVGEITPLCLRGLRLSRL